MKDVVVIGGGFAGLTAARELGHRGRSVVLLEARERLGGRTWLAPFAGVEVEMGGGFVHRTQPHLWAELTRYGLGVVELPDAERSFLRTDDGVLELAPADWTGLLAAFERACHDAAALVPNPMVPPRGGAAGAADRETIADRLRATDLAPLERELLDSLGAALSSTTNDRVGYLWGFAKPYALAGLSAQRLFDANGRWSIAGGTRALIGAVARDTRAEIRLGDVARAIAQDRGRVSVSAADGGEVTARTAIVALPVNALGAVRFEPELSPTKREAVKGGLSSRGLKVWARLAAGIGSAFSAAPDRFPLSFVETVAKPPDGGAVVLGFGPSADGLPLSQPEAVAGAIEDLLPGARVDEVGGHDWAHDPFARETWATYPPGTYLRWMPELERMEGRVAFAGGDIARGWAGYIDGAIETGLRAAREVDALLR